MCLAQKRAEVSSSSQVWAAMLNSNAGVDPSNPRQFQPQFNAGQLQGGGGAFPLGGGSLVGTLLQC